MKQDETNQTRRTLSLKRVVLGLLVIAAALVASTAIAEPARSAQSGLPAHAYAGTKECHNYGTFGNIISAWPTRLDAFDGIDKTVVNGPPNPLENMRQSIYYRLWVYSYNTGRWTPSSYKRVRNGIVLEPEEFVRPYGWVDAGGDVLSVSGSIVNLLNPPEVGVAVGRGWQYVKVESYWEPPSYTTNMLNPNPRPGGWRTYDVLGYCRF
jgi:hypothetical protein